MPSGILGVLATIVLAGHVVNINVLNVKCYFFFTNDFFFKNGLFIIGALPTDVGISSPHLISNKLIHVLTSFMP